MAVQHPEAPEHLVIVIHSLRGGGAERVVSDISAWYVSKGHRVTVVTQTDADSDVYSLDSRVQRLSMRTAGDSGGAVQAALSNVRRILRLRRMLKRLQPTVVLGMMTTSSVLAVLATRGLPCRVLASEHTHPPAQRLPRMWQTLRRRTYPRAHAVVALTHGTADWLREHIPGSTVHVIPNAVRWPLHPSDPVVPVPETPGRYRLLAVGRLHPVKGFDRLITAFASIAERFPRWDMTILGEGPEREALEEQAREAGLEARIQFSGRVGNIGDWYQASDLYALSSRAEGLSNTLLEAMASGLAAVAVDCDTGPREIIRHEVDGVLVNPPDDIDALAAHLSDLMAHPERRAALSRRAVDVRDRFSVARIMHLWQGLLR